MTKAKVQKQTMVRVSAESRKVLGNLAREIFARNQIELKEAHITRPSARVAIDYLIAIAKNAGNYDVEPWRPQENIYLRYCDKSREEDQS